MRIPRNHPRYQSLRIRELLVKGMKEGIVVPEGLLAHGRGEAFDYLIGEKTGKAAGRAIEAAAAALLTAKSPVLSVNGNTAALVPREVSKLASIIPAKVEVNLFHRSVERERRIARLMSRYGVKDVLGVGASASEEIRGVSSRRKMVDPAGIGAADVIVVPLEDGDRSEALARSGRLVIAVDLNPLSRTAQAASITIVDNAVRAFPGLMRMVTKLKRSRRSSLERVVSGFDNKKNILRGLEEMMDYLEGWRVKS